MHTATTTTEASVTITSADGPGAAQASRVLNEEQGRAVDLARTEQRLILTGGTGTGKTFTIKAILTALDAEGRRTALCAPTGKAARRMTEQTGREASTIHRLLKWNPGQSSFEHGDGNPLPYDAVVVDETSMVDTALMAGLLRAASQRTKVVLVGDADQLPSVGPGSVLRDLLASGAVPAVRLVRIYRQSEKSWIAENARRINAGEPPVIDNQDSEDFFWFDRDDADEAAACVVDLVTRRLPQGFKFDPVRDVQVLSPQRSGAVGVEGLNNLLQRALNPRASAEQEEWVFSERVFRAGDRVMHVRNDYDLGVMNGEQGVVKALRRADEHDEGVRAGTPLMDVDLGDRVVAYTKEAAMEELVTAYAVTIHKSQGSQYPAVVVPVHSQHSYMLSRPLIYTAITRAERVVCLVGNAKGLARAVKNVDVVRRETGLPGLLAASAAQ